MPDLSIQYLIDLVRPEIRREKQYVVPGDMDVANKLNQNECPFPLPDDLKKELADALVQIPFNRYPGAQPNHLIEALARQHNHPVDGILAGNGSNELTHTIGLSFMTADTRVVTPRPMFALFESVVRMYGAEVIPVAPLPDLHLDTEGILDAIRVSNPVLTILASPNNPTGLAMTLQDIERICAQSKGFVLVDEAYHDFNSERSALELMPRYPNVLVMRTLSKAAGLAGLRLGYLMGQPAVIQELLKARVPFMVDRLSETVACALLAQPDMLKERVNRVIDSIRQLTAALRNLPGVSIIPSATNFLLFKTSLDPSRLSNHLQNHHVLIRNMSGYPELDGFLRVSAGTEPENKAFIGALKSALEGVS